MSRQKAGNNDKRAVQRRAFLRATANISVLVATLSTSLGVSISQAVAEGHSKLKLGESVQLKVGESVQIKWFRSRGGGRTALREYELKVEDGRALLVTADGKKALAKDGQYLLQDDRLVTVSGGVITELRAAKGAP